MAVVPPRGRVGRGGGTPLPIEGAISGGRGGGLEERFDRTWGDNCQLYGGLTHSCT